MRLPEARRSFWGPLLGSLLGGIEYEKRWLARRTRAAVAAARKAGIEPKKATQQRPGDIWWAYHLTLKLRGMDYNVSTALPYSGEQKLKNDRRPLCCRDARGVNRVRNEQTKLTKLSKVGNLSDGASAVKVITPVCFSTTGAGTKLAIKFFRQLAAVAHPGDDKDPGVRHARAAPFGHCINARSTRPCSRRRSMTSACASANRSLRSFTCPVSILRTSHSNRFLPGSTRRSASLISALRSLLRRTHSSTLELAWISMMDNRPCCGASGSLIS